MSPCSPAIFVNRRNLETGNFQLVGIGAREFEIAVDAYTQYGRGRHAAALNISQPVDAGPKARIALRQSADALANSGESDLHRGEAVPNRAQSRGKAVDLGVDAAQINQRQIFKLIDHVMLPARRLTTIQCGARNNRRSTRRHRARHRDQSRVAAGTADDRETDRQAVGRGARQADLRHAGEPAVGAEAEDAVALRARDR